MPYSIVPSASSSCLQTTPEYSNHGITRRHQQAICEKRKKKKEKKRKEKKKKKKENPNVAPRRGLDKHKTINFCLPRPQCYLFCFYTPALCAQKCNSSRKLVIFFIVSSCYCFRARNIVSVVCSIVLSTGSKLFV